MEMGQQTGQKIEGEMREKEEDDSLFLISALPGRRFCHKPRTVPWRALFIMFDHHYEERKSHFTLEIQVISRYFIFTQSHSDRV